MYYSHRGESMPIAFSLEEKERIKNKLIDVGMKYMNDRPISKISVDSIVKKVGISKGAFYIFYESKELLFFDCLLAIHKQIEMKIYSLIKESNQSDGRKLFKDIIITMLKEVDKMPWLINLSNENYTVLTSKIGEEQISKHLKEDNLMVTQIVSLLNIKDADIEFFTAVFRSLFFMLLHKKEIGEAVFYDVIEFQVDAIIKQMNGEC